MAHFTDPAFWRLYAALPKQVRKLADKNFALLKHSADHPSLQFKKVKGRDRLWSARVGRGYRALAMEVDGGHQWFWIGTHGEYDRLIG
jgi:mRNA-degrading endonuclease RelE of RelBE toxin-antitoxin system